MEHFISSEKKPIRESKACTHSRLIDDVYDHDGARTGLMRCLECMSNLDHPPKSGEQVID
jgi:hypothetical protein